MKGPSKAYHDAVAEGARHHQSSKTYSGSFLRPHKPYLAEMSALLQCHSGLDVGAGKGGQYSWIDPSDGMTSEQALGFQIEKHDPCWPPYAAEPEGKFDLVICTHTISLIPASDLDWFIDRIARFADKAVFIAEQIGGRKKKEVADPYNRNIGKPAKFWIDRIGQASADYPHLFWAASLRTTEPRGKITTRHIWQDGKFKGSVEAKPRRQIT